MPGTFSSASQRREVGMEASMIEWRTIFKPSFRCYKKADRTTKSSILDNIMR